MSLKPENLFDKEFRDRLSNSEQKTSEQVWENISSHLDRLDKNSKSRFLLPWYINTSLALILASVMGYGIYRALSYSKDVKQEQTSPIETPQNETISAPSTADLNSTKSEELVQDVNTDISSTINNATTSNRQESLSKKSNHNINRSLKSKTLNNSNHKLNISNSNTEGLTIPNTIDKNIANSKSVFPSATANQTNTATPISELKPQEQDANSLIQRQDQSDLKTSSQVTLSEITEKSLILDQTRVAVPEQIKGKTATTINSSKKQSAKNKMLTDYVDGCVVRRENRSGWFLDAYISPEIFAKRLQAKPGDPSLSNYVDIRKRSENYSFAYSIGTRLSYHMQNGVALRGGLSYSKLVDRFDFITDTIFIRKITPKPNGVSDTTYEEMLHVENNYNHYNYLDIPLIVGYDIPLKDFVCTFNTGLVFNLMTSQAGYIYNKDTEKTNLDGNKESGNIFKANAGVSWMFGMGLNYKFNNRLTLIAEPTMTTNLKSLSDVNYQVDQKFTKFGLMAGLRYKIK